MIIDQAHDPSYKRLYNLLQEFPQIEPHIKTAHVGELEEETKLASSAFAWPELRLFRIDKPDQAALSRLYMHKQAGVPIGIVERCDAALDLYGVSLDFLGEEKVAASEDPADYLLPEMKRFRVRTPTDVKTAAVALLHHYYKMDVNTRATAAVNLVKKASQHNVELSTPIYKLAGATMCDPHTLCDWVEARAEATTDPAIKRAYTKLAEATRAKEVASQQFLNNRQDLIKIADSLMELDEAAGLTQHYDRRLPDPMLTVFNTDKIAEETIELAGKPVEVSRLLAIPPEAYQDVFGEDLANEFIVDGTIDPVELKVILPTVPLDLQQALAAQMGV